MLEDGGPMILSLPFVDGRSLVLEDFKYLSRDPTVGVVYEIVGANLEPERFEAQTKELSLTQ